MRNKYFITFIAICILAVLPNFLYGQNDPPVLSNIESSTLSYTEGDSPADITSNISISDADDDSLQSATIQITSNYLSSEDVLDFTNTASITGSWNPITGTLTLTGGTTLVNYRTALRNVSYENTNTDDPSTSTRTATFRVYDGEDYSNTQSRNISITAVNDAPVLSGIEGSALSYTEEDPPVDITSTIVITDVDDIYIESATVEITGNYDNLEDELSFTDAGGISGSWDSGSGILTLTGSATVATYRTALRNVSYENTNTEDPSTATRTVTFQVYDGDNYSNTQSRNITITPENDPPVLSGIEGSALSYTENDGPVDITSTIVITDVDDINIESATIQITSNYLSSEDVLDFTNTAFITGSWNSSLGRLTLNGSTTIANYRTALRNVSYENTNTDDPSTSTRAVTFRVFDGNDVSNTQSRNINITAENDPPVLTAIEGSTLSYTEDAGPVDITSTIVVTDGDDINIEAATIQITSNYLEGEDTLVFTNTAFISASWNSSLGRLTLTGSTTLANYQTALRNVAYENTSDDPSTSLRTVTFIAFDGDDPSNTQTRNISITPENDPPVLSEIEVLPLDYIEGAGEVDITDSIVVEDEDDTNIESAIIQITSNYQLSEDRLRFTNTPNISGSWNFFAGRLTLSGSDTKANYQSALRNVAYENIDLLNPSTVTRTVSFTINDGTDNSNTETRNISFTEENDPPVLSNVEPVPLDYTEEDGPIDITSSITITDDDDDSLEYATIQITSNYLDTEDVLDFTNTPSITSSWNSSTGTLTLSGSTTLANYQTALRNVSYENTNDEDPSTLSRIVTFIVNDGDDPSNAILRTINITGVNDPPELVDIEESPLSYTEDEGPVEITSTISIFDVDDDSLEYATIRITTNYIFSEDTLRFTDTPGITSSWNQFTGTLTLTGPDTKLNFQAALRNIAYENTNTLDPSILIREVTFRVNDGDDFSNTQERNITITPVNDPPELSDIETTPISYSEGDGAVQITTTMLLEDFDDVNIESATVQIMTNYINSEDTLRFEDTPEITSSWNQFTGTLTLTGTALNSQYQTALRNVKYENLDTLSVVPLTRTVVFLVNDGDDISNIQSRNISVSEDNDPPIAYNVLISAPGNNFVVNTNLTGLYDYDDPENDPEGTSAYIWYRADNAEGTDSVEISGADENNYITRIADGGNYLSFGVIPSDNKGATSPFIFNSTWKYINDGPVALNLSIAGAKAIDQTDTASFEYFDTEDDPENPVNHYYQWYRDDDGTGDNREAIFGATNKTYTITNQDNHKYIAVEVALASTTGTLLGDTAMSIWYGPISNLPSATITETDTICPDEETEITISYIGENPPWSITYTIDGGDPFTISDIDENETSFFTSDTGLYELVTITDDRYKDVKISDSIRISNYKVPTVVLSGIVTDICDDGVTVGVLEADFTGESPWTLTLDRPAGNDTIYTDITQDPFTMDVLDEYNYRINTLADANCIGDTTGSGSVYVKHQESPEATISGTDTICPGDTAYLTVTLDEGILPWQFTYTVDGLDTTTITNINEASYTLEVFDEGVYELESVEDPLCTGKTAGTGLVYYRSLPTATLSGGGAMCQGTNTSIVVNLTGIAPWDFSYKITTDTTIFPVNNVLTSPRQVYVTEEGQYILTEVTDKYCPGTVSGTVYVSIIPVDPVTLQGLQQAYSYTDDPVPLSGDPEGGSFSGPGLIESNDTTYFLPGWAGITEEDDPPHKIIYSYQFPSGCYGRDTVKVRVLSTTASIIFPDNKTFYCYNDEPFTVEGFNIFKNPDTTMVLGEFSVSGGLGLVDNGDNTATIDPQILQDGIFTITYSKSNGNSFEETEQFEVQFVDQITIIGFTDHEYCSNDEDVSLIGNVTEGVFYGNHVTKIGTEFYFVPSFEPAGVDTIFYSYTTPQGCSRVTFDTAFIFDAPEISFMVDDVCIAVGTNDSTQFINNTTSSAPVVSWEWDFGDPGSLDYNTSTLENPKHLYSDAQTRPVSLIAETDECRATATEYIDFGDVPVADFNWESECYLSGIPIRFTNNSTSDQGSISSNEWKFYNNGAYSLSYDENPEITYTNHGDYNVELIVETDYQCVDTVIKTLHLRRTIVAEYEYFEDFEEGVSGWYPDYISNSEFNTNSWTFGEPDPEGGFSGAASGINAWYTDVVTTGRPSEKSWVTGPCFDFRDTERPMIKLNIQRLFEGTRDAAVLQYTDDSAKTWNNVGDYEDGINWFNDFNIPVMPGDNSVGWSEIEDNNWTEARHELDNLKGKTNVQFRIAYASDGTAKSNHGIAFDNIWIGERKKKVLVEHFTNTLENDCREADSLLNNLVNYSNDVIDIQYHTSFPEGDPFFLHDQSSSGTREVYYGLSSVPYSMIDGGVTSAYRFDYDLKDIEEIVIDTQALKDPLFELLLNTENTGNNIDINCALTALTDIGNSWITLYIAVIEREITQITGESQEKIYESVVKKMLPVPSGTSYNRSWTAGEQVTVNESWNYTNVFDADEIRVVAFVQNQNTGEIYQAAIDTSDDIPTINNDIHVNQPIKLLVYPNPSSGITYIRFNQPLTEECRMDLFSNMGKLLYSSLIHKGEELVHFNTENYNNGLYILRIANKKRVIDVKKLIISR
ncbi:MAG: T9SS type A sorting domain-containing protein [Bacteroidales bacterium]|nr:MAG: T9SS type A sorting domain-containing protein [Bacteroidales bacterium]